MLLTRYASLLRCLCAATCHCCMREELIATGCSTRKNHIMSQPRSIVQPLANFCLKTLSGSPACRLEQSDPISPCCLGKPLFLLHTMLVAGHVLTATPGWREVEEQSRGVGYPEAASWRAKSMVGLVLNTCTAPPPCNLPVQEDMCSPMCCWRSSHEVPPQ